MSSIEGLQINHLYYIRSLICVTCPEINGIQAAHIRMGNGGGMAKKPHDKHTVPLCHKCHAEQHRIGEMAFWGDVSKATELALSLWDVSGDREKGLIKIFRYRNAD